MKLFIITAIKEFEFEVKKILKRAGVKNFSYSAVKGHKDDDSVERVDNWFASEAEMDSLVFMAFVSKEHADKVQDQIRLFNQKQEFLSHIHVAVLNLESSI